MDLQEGGGSDKSKQAVRWVTPHFQRKAFSDAWLALLRLHLPDDLYKKVAQPLCLECLADDVLNTTSVHNIGGLAFLKLLWCLFPIVPLFLGRQVGKYSPHIFLPHFTQDLAHPLLDSQAVFFPRDQTLCLLVSS